MLKYEVIKEEGVDRQVVAAFMNELDALWFRDQCVCEQINPAIKYRMRYLIETQTLQPTNPVAALIEAYDEFDQPKPWE
jgi:hypothetical protein